MKNILSIFLLACLPLWVMAQDSSPKTFKIGPQTDVQIAGTSSLHDWHCDVESIKGDIKLIRSESALVGIHSMVLNFATNSIKSGKAAMDKNTYKALHATEHPLITFRYSRTVSNQVQGNKVKLSVEGNLTISGTTRMVIVAASGEVQPDGHMVFSGQTKLNMKEYGVDPQLQYSARSKPEK